MIILNYIKRREIMNDIVYSTEAKLQKIDGRQEVTLSDNDSKLVFGGLPASLGGKGPDKAFNPEHFFAAGYTACFFGAAEHLFNLKHVKHVPVEVSVKVDLVKREGGLKLDATMHLKYAGITLEEAKEATEKIHAFCPYTYTAKETMEINTNIEII
jgi:lipoyl-dependent peroxiredoxin